MSDIDGGGPAFPCAEDHKVAADLPWTCGMTKRDLFAAILMHSEAVTCGVPGEACEALVEASREAGTDVIDHMAGNAVAGADALLRALGAPRQPEFRNLYASEQRQIDAAVRLANAVNALKDQVEYGLLPHHVRAAIDTAIDDVLDPEIPF